LFESLFDQQTVDVVTQEERSFPRGRDPAVLSPNAEGEDAMVDPQTPPGAPAPAPRHPLEQISFFGIFLRRLLAWRMRHAAAAELTILEARRRVAEAQRITQEAEAEVTLQQALQAAPGEQGVQLLGPQAEIERLLLERERLRRQRLQQALAGGGSLLAGQPAVVEWEISDREIESMAVKAVTQFAGLEPYAAQQAWSAWRRDLELRLPPYAAHEVARRAEQLRQMAG
jgi:hypothetical protein